MSWMINQDYLGPVVADFDNNNISFSAFLCVFHKLVVSTAIYFFLHYICREYICAIQSVLVARLKKSHCAQWSEERNTVQTFLDLA